MRDIESAETGKKVQKLSSIKVSDTAGNLIKTTMLEYKYLLSGMAATTNGYDDRLLLSKVYECGWFEEEQCIYHGLQYGEIAAQTLSVCRWPGDSTTVRQPMTASLKI